MVTHATSIGWESFERSDMYFIGRHNSHLYLASSFLIKLEHIHIFKGTCLEVPLLRGVIDVLRQLAIRTSSTYAAN